MKNGILIVDKEKGYTSFDVVAKARGILKMKRIGHAGTLDPNATGVLPLLLGNATKLCDIFPDATKTYEATLLLGMETDTDDIYGEVLRKEELTVSGNFVSSGDHTVTEEDIREVMASFVGPYEQVPPMVSAKKVNGKKLYELARKKITVSRSPVPREIYSLEITKISLPRVSFRVSVSRGTYIRVLISDIGKKLGIPAVMSDLRRISHGAYSETEAHTLAEIEKAVLENRIDDWIHPVESAFPHLPRYTVKPESERFLKNGNLLFPHNFIGEENICPEQENEILAFTVDRSVFGYYMYDKKENAYRVFRMFFKEE